MISVTCPSPHEMTWWSDKCSDCGHLLAMHRGVGVAAFGECSLCVMHNELKASIAAQDAALRVHAEGMRDAAKTYAADLNTTAKTYVDNKDTLVRKDMPTWVNNRIAQVVKSTALNADPRTAP